MTQADNLLEDLIGGEEELIEDPFSIFAQAAWKPNAAWDSEPMTREAFAQQIFDLAKSGHHEARAVRLQAFASEVAKRLGGARTLTIDLANETSYTYNEDTGTATFLMDYRTTLIGATENQQLNAFIGLLVRGVGEHRRNLPDSKVREFIKSIDHDFSKFVMPEIGDYAGQQAAIALTDRAISAEIYQEWPGFGQYALDGLYQLQAQAAQKRMSEIHAALDSGTDPASGKDLTRDQRKQLELEMAGTLLQAETTAPGNTFVDSSRFPWAADIEQSATMYRNITDLETDHEYASQGNTIYSKVVERILDIPDKPPTPSGGAPDLSKLQEFQEDLSGAGDTASSTSHAKNSMQNAAGLASDVKVKFDVEKFNKMKDEEAEAGDENTPWAEGNPVMSYFTVAVKPGPVARARYEATKQEYRAQISRLRHILKEQYATRYELERGLRSGRPDANRLVNVRFGKTDVFKHTKQHVDGEPIDIILLLDESGSMGSRVNAKGYRQVPKFLGGVSGTGELELAGSEADGNVSAEEGGGTRIDVARAMGVMLAEAVRNLPGIRLKIMGYATSDRSHFGLPASKHGHWNDSIIRKLGDEKNPYGVALTCAYGGNGDAQALHEAVKQLSELEDESAARKAIIYLADGGISDPVLEEMLRNIQKRIPIYFVDMSNSVRGTGGSLKIKHSVTVNSIDEAVRGLAGFFKNIVLGGHRTA
ncbi:hypothetical protein Dxin01_00103 [Deinococcus xinjiangensis]|uniref:VWFA domain-containing protein n=1 Tax=Deinococcus xinjiangensis TaxID=457454 RepID=A0ABP9V518_9DEIO